MAKRKNLRELGIALGLRGEELEDAITDTVRLASIAALSSATLGTPIDEGRAKGNWFVASGSPDHSSIDDSRKGKGKGEAKPIESKTILRANPVIKAWKVGQGSIFITNNLPYVVKLDEGSSVQASEGMTAQALSAARQVMSRQRRIFRDRIKKRGS